MRYYTKEWYQLMQGLHYVSGMTVLPDKEYTEEEIRGFYDADLAEEIERDRRIYEELNLPFDPAETIQCFEECYQGVKKYCLNSYPEWAREFIDPRLVALNRITEGIYNRLKELEDANQAAFDAINAEAQAVLDRQNIPEEIHSIFRFHDAEVLTLKRRGRDAELYLSYGEELPDGKSPYMKVTFKNISFIEREKGLVFRKKVNGHGIWSSSITYLYDELYRTDNGYEVHMLLWSGSGLRYLTIGCGEIQFEDNITLSTL